MPNNSNKLINYIAPHQHSLFLFPFSCFPFHQGTKKLTIHLPAGINTTALAGALNGARADGLVTEFLERGLGFGYAQGVVAVLVAGAEGFYYG